MSMMMMMMMMMMTTVSVLQARRYVSLTGSRVRRAAAVSRTSGSVTATSTVRTGPTKPRSAAATRMVSSVYGSSGPDLMGGAN